MRNRAVRLFAVGIAAASLVAVSGTPAVAAPIVACSKATFKNTSKTTSTSIMSMCTNAAVSGGGAKLVANFANLNKITAKITWNNNKGVTNYTVKQKGGAASANKCHLTNGKKDALIVSTGTFVSGTGAAGKALKGKVYKESLCVPPSLKLYLNPGSKITFG